MIRPEPATLESLALLVIELQGRIEELTEEVARLTTALQAERAADSGRYVTP